MTENKNRMKCLDRLAKHNTLTLKPLETKSLKANWFLSGSIGKGVSHYCGLDCCAGLPVRLLCCLYREYVRSLMLLYGCRSDGTSINITNGWLMEEILGQKSRKNECVSWEPFVMASGMRRLWT